MDCLIHPIQKYIHNKRFPDLKMDKLTYARYVMAGMMTREEALKKVEHEQVKDENDEEIMSLFLRNIGMTRNEFDNYVNLGPRHLDYHPQPSIGLKFAKKAFRMKDAGAY
jgi:hypothetical protein